jgi:hypothetical protein
LGPLGCFGAMLLFAKSAVVSSSSIVFGASISSLLPFSSHWYLHQFLK